MSSPVSPSQFKQLILSVSGNFCEKFLNLLNMPKLFSDWYSYTFLESGEFTDEFKADICAIGCVGGGTTPGTGLGNPSINASDGQFPDKIQIMWSAVTGAATFDLYRNTQNNAATASILAHDLSSTTYNDATVTPGTYYYYFVVAKSATLVSSRGLGDRGFAGAVSLTLTAITDLQCSQGFGRLSGDKIALVFSPVSGADSYDFYRNTTDDFNTAALIDAGRQPFDNSVSFSSGPSPSFVDNGGELLYLHNPYNPGDPITNLDDQYFFWIVAKRSLTAPPAVSLQSNSAKGWVIGRGLGIPPFSPLRISSTGVAPTNEETVPVNATTAWIALFGGNAGGAGGDGSFGGGGGGAGAAMTGTLSVVAGGKIRIISSPEADTSNAASVTDGDAGPVTSLEYSAAGDYSDTVSVAVCAAPGGGVFNAVGGGVGGGGATAANNTLVGPKTYNGRDGKPGAGTVGGRGGQHFGSTRTQPAHVSGFGGGGFNGDGGGRGGGGGSSSAPGHPVDATGGKGLRGFANITFYS